METTNENIRIDIIENGIITLATAGKYCDRNIDVNVNCGIQSASGTYTLATSASNMKIDVSDIGFVPDLAIVYVDDTELEYTNEPTKMWFLSYQPDLLDFFDFEGPADGGDATTNIALSARGAKGTYSLMGATRSNNCIYKETSSGNVVIRVNRYASSYPILVGTYKWFAYKIWG